jgi:monoamine oxidase
MSDSAFAGRPIEQREAINDSRGHVAELLAKAIRKGALDEEITASTPDRVALD